MRFRHLRTVTAAACTVFSAGCVTNPGNPAGDSSNQVRQLFASDDPCSNNARNIGIAGGVLAGLVLGKTLGNGKTESLAAGALVGGLIGGLIGSDMDRKRCELSKVAKQFDLAITFSPIDANGEVQTTADIQSKRVDTASSPQNPVGTVLTVRDKGGSTGHFESGSDQLTPKAREYFAVIAEQYSAEKMLDGQSDAKRRDAVGKQVAQRRIFLIGHTDDTGSSQLNASLSERRARSVASYLKQRGIQEDSLYFQGAGETLPIADNRSDSGRAENRRVEMIEVADEAGFKKYLEARKPNYQFYRPTEVTPVAVATATEPSKPAASVTKPVATGSKLATNSKSKKNAAAIETSSTTKANPPQPPIINFGGVPYSPMDATMNVGSLIPEKSKFSLMSKAYAADTVVLSDCTRDRPRSTGSVKSLRDGKVYKTNEYLPQLYGKTWASNVNGNLVVINHLAVLRDGGTPANLPEFKVYSQYQAANPKKPEVNEESPVNSYLVGQGVLYRMFPRGDGGLKCVDVLLAADGSTTAKDGKLVYGAGASNFVANFKPQMQ